MPAKRPASSPDAILGRLSALRQLPSSPEFDAELRKAAAHASPVVVARAAELAAAHKKIGLVPDLVAAFERLGGPASADKLFAGRAAVARALVDLDAGDADAVYLRGVRTHGAMPGRYVADDAPNLRAASAFGLVNVNHRDAQFICADLLVDPFPLVRSAAARALGASGQPSAALLLRLKVRVGDPEPEVIAECVTGMMAVAPAQSLDVAAELLRSDDLAPRAAAAVAIGLCRQPQALDLLRGALGREPEPDVRRTILLAAVTTRSAEAVDWLIEVVATAGLATAADAVEALAPYRLDDAVRRRVSDAVAARAEAALSARLREVMG